MTIDFDLLNGSIEDAEAEVNYRHNQIDWASVVEPEALTEAACGTAMCLGGFAGVRAGAEIPVPQRDVYGDWRMPFWEVDPTTGELSSSWGAVHIGDFARDRMGLTQRQASALFGATNTLKDIRAMRDHLREHPDAGYNDLYALRD